MTRSNNCKKGSKKAYYCRLEDIRREKPFYTVDWFTRPPSRTSMKIHWKKFWNVV